jgi:excinuclease UvrABC nuclease subunit
MESTRTPVQRIKSVGFRRVGEWKLDTDKLQCALTDCQTAVNVLYAFASDDEVLYIGKSVRSLKQRLYGYQSPGPKQFTNIKANKLIREALGIKKVIIIYAFVDRGELHCGEFRVNLAAGLEDNLIATLKPSWNKQGRTDKHSAIRHTIDTKNFCFCEKSLCGINKIL